MSPPAPLPAHLVLRSLEEADYDKGYLALLAQLTTVGEISREAWRARFAEIAARQPDHQIAVVEDTRSGKVVACATVLIERKFIHGCGKIGHVEDVAVDASARGSGLGARVVAETLRRAKEQGAYKVILDCAEKNVGFYEKSGLARKDVNMAVYF